jgi:hypothetical protein
MGRCSKISQQLKHTPAPGRRYRALSFARQLAKEYFQRYPKDRYETEVESWRQIQSQNIEFTMKRLREPVART